MLLLSKNKVHFVNIGKTVVLECPVCKYAARSTSDLESIEKEGACTECTLNFKYLDLEAWKKGERPSLEKARSKIFIKVGDF